MSSTKEMVTEMIKDIEFSDEYAEIFNMMLKKEADLSHETMEKVLKAHAVPEMYHGMFKLNFGKLKGYLPSL
jgi:hypothetical protein